MVMMQVVWLILSGATMFIITNLTDKQLFYLAMPTLDLTLLLVVTTLFIYNKDIYLQLTLIAIIIYHVLLIIWHIAFFKNILVNKNN